MERYAPKLMELGPRDIVARGIQTEIDEGRGFEGGYIPYAPDTPAAFPITFPS